MHNNYDQLIRNGCREFLPEHYDWRILKAQLFQESRFQPDATSPAGAMGIAQIMPETWNDWALPNFSQNPYDAEASIMVGARYMGYQYKQWMWPRPEIDRVCLAMAGYNAGLGNILKAQKLSGNKLHYKDIIKFLPDVTGSHSAETIGYVKKILGFWCQEIT